MANAHIVIAKPDAVFGLTEIRIGFWPVLIFRAVEQAMGRAPHRGTQPYRSGFHREGGARLRTRHARLRTILCKRAHEVAVRLAGFSPIAIGAGLDYVHQIRGQDWEHAGKVGRQTRNRLLENEDFKEGSRAFLEKRQPSWPSLNRRNDAQTPQDLWKS